jgi:succinate dehydrogenase hydrophobic anchor subunit
MCLKSISSGLFNILLNNFFIYFLKNKKATYSQILRKTHKMTMKLCIQVDKSIELQSTTNIIS